MLSIYQSFARVSIAIDCFLQLNDWRACYPGLAPALHPGAIKGSLSGVKVIAGLLTVEIKA